MDILRHPAARWGPDDFDLPIQPSMHTSLESAPQYLQPVHEPQIRLPSFSSWFTVPQNDQFASLPTFEGHNGSGRGQSFVSSPALTIPPPFQMLKWPGTDAGVAYTGLHDHDYMAPPVQTAFRNPWESSAYADNWANDGVEFAADNRNFDRQFAAQQPPQPPTLQLYSRHEASLLHPYQVETYTMPTLPQQETPHVSATPHHILSPTDHDSFYTAKSEEQSADLNALLTPSSQSPPSASGTEAVAETAEAEETSVVERDQSLDLPYVHSLCGKAFSTLTGVRKHHWGKKAKDLNTTTGCWAKHNKPDVAWDDHPSCKDGRSKSVATKIVPPAAKQRQTKISLSQSSAPPVSDGPQFQPLPGFPTLEDLPHTVAKAVNASLATNSSLREPEMIDQTSLVASRRSFDTLLTAVNEVSQIDAPKPKGRADSIALNLDAQVAAAEQHHPVIPNMSSKSSHDSPSFRAIAPAALDITGNPLTGECSNNVGGHRMNFVNEKQPSVFPSDLEAFYDSGAIPQPFQPLVASSSSPARKKRKV